MIISPEQIFWLLTDSRLDDKAIIKLAKFKGINVSDSLRKTLSNVFYKKNKQSETTINGLKRFFKELCSEDERLIKEIESDISLLKCPVSFEYIESGYTYFLTGAKLENSFIAHEIQEIFSFVKAILPISEGDFSVNSFEEKRSKNRLLSHFFNCDYFIDIRSTGVIGFVFSLDIVIYLFVCFELAHSSIATDKKNSIGKEILNKLTVDFKNKKKESSFWYYTYFWKKKEDITFEKMSELLDIDIRIFNHYKSGDRNIKKMEHINSVLDKGGFYYVSIVFWIRIIGFLCKEEDITFLSEKYDYYFSLAEERIYEQRAEKK